QNHHKYVLSDNQLFVREGFWRQKCTILPIRKVQSVDISQSFLARALGNADIVIGVAGGSGILPLTVHTIAQQECQNLRAKLLTPALT
ncbi:PH domain-containing protein, partial [Sphingorhabdus sp. Alg239-R122]|uniref:PH domain-containing protein n=1 Tax=Sphingorhabdus sp. Alg239-R122 TaxID=2305989 RepID=UPI0013D92830